MAEIAVLPIWKKGANFAERVEEVANYVRANPERFAQFVMVYIEHLPNGNLKIRTLDFGCDLQQLLGLIELGKNQIIQESKA